MTYIINEAFLALSFFPKSPNFMYAGESSQNGLTELCCQSVCKNAHACRISTPRQGENRYPIRRGSGLFIAYKAFGDAWKEIDRTSFHVFFFTLTPTGLEERRDSLTYETEILLTSGKFFGVDAGGLFHCGYAAD